MATNNELMHIMMQVLEQHTQTVSNCLEQMNQSLISIEYQLKEVLYLMKEE